MNTMKNENEGKNNDSRYMPELMAEKDSLDTSFVHAGRLLNQEIENIKNPNKSKPKTFRNVMKDEVIKIEEDIIIPVQEYPNVNFVGRLIGPGGSTMKGIQEISNTRIGVLGKGSVRPGKEFDKSDPKYAHLDLPQHVHISAMGTLPNVYYNMSVAITEIQKLLQMDDDTAVQFAVAQGMTIPPNRREGGPGAPRGRGGMQRGGQRGFGGPGGRGGGRGRGGMGNGSGARGRGAIGGGSPGMTGGRGAMQSRGGAPTNRGQRGGRGMPNRGRGAPGGGFQAPKPAVDPYASAGGDYANSYDFSQDYQEFDNSYDTSFDETAAYEDSSFGMNQSFEYGSFDRGMGAGAGGAAGFGGAGGSAKQNFPQKPFRGKAPRGGVGRGRGGGVRGISKPY